MSLREVSIPSLVAKITTAYLSYNKVQQGDLIDLILIVERTLRELEARPEAPAIPLTPSVRIDASVNEDHIICLEDGCKFKSIKRHLRSVHGLTPTQYRQKWNLPGSYPMVAPGYTKIRSKIAKDLGLGKGRRRQRKR